VRYAFREELGLKMAKKSQIARDSKRKNMHSKYEGKRDALKAERKAAVGNPAELARIQFELAKLPLNSSPSRLKNRCAVTGRSRGYIRKFGLSRITFREMAHRGFLPGVTKSSW